MSIVPSLHSIRAAGPAALEIAVETPFDFLAPEYKALHQRSGATAFQCPDWLATLHRYVPPAVSAEPITLTVRSKSDGRLLMVLPFVRRRCNGLTVVEFTDFGVCDHIRAIYDPLDAPLLLADDTLAARVAKLIHPCDIVSFSKLPDEDPVLGRLLPKARRA